MRVLIATVTAGGGHVQAGAALEEAWRDLRPRDVVKRVDVLEFTPAPYRRAYSRGYVKLVEHAPELYARYFRKTDDAGWMRKAVPLRRGVARLAARKFLALVGSFRPDAVLCPHFLPLEALGSVRRWDGPRPFIASVVTDFEAHAMWMEPCVDQYFTAMPETRARLVARGVSPERVSAFGIPVSRRFRTVLDRRKARARLDLPATGPALLVLGGGFGMGPVRDILARLDEVRRPLHTVVVAGKNPTLERTLRGLSLRHPARIFGFVDNMQDLMAASDLIVTKPGGLTTAEALALGRPLLIVDPIPGQEAANSDFLLEHGAAAKINRLEDLPHRVERLLVGDRLKRLARAARRLGRPRAAEKICRQVVQCVSK